MLAQPSCLPRLPLLALAGIVWLLASSPASAAESYFCNVLGITFPGSLGGLPLVEVEDFERNSRGLGVGLFYRSGGIKGDTYIYNYGASEIPTGPESKLILDHFYAVSRDVVLMESLGHYQDVKVITQKELVKLGAVDFLHAEMHFIQENEPMESHIYLAALSNQFVKIRFTFPQAQAEKAKGIREAYLKEFGALLSGSRPEA